MEITHKSLQEATKDLNVVFGVKPQLKIIAARPVLEKGIRDTLARFVAVGDGRIDELAEETINVYNQLVKPDTLSDLSEVADELAEEDALETVPAGEGEEECPAFGKEFDSAAPECTECARAEECAPLTQKTKPKTSKPKEAKEAKIKYGRMNAFCDVLSHNVGVVLPREQVVAQTDARYVEAGGVSNLKESAWIVRSSIRAMVFLGIVEETKEGYKYLGPPTV